MSEQQNKPELNEESVAPEAVENASAEEVLEGADAETEVQVAQLQKELDEALQTISDQKESVLRAKAEVENIRRRAAQDVEKAHKYALDKFAGDLLDTVDNLERALQAADQADEKQKPLIEGIELTLKSFVGTIEKHGMQAIDPMGQPFDPNKHQAMAMQPSAEHEPNTVMMVMQKGYELNGRVIRPAMVMVAQASVDTQA